MAKSKPDVVHVHRIEMQKKERELLESAVNAYQIRNISQPFVALLSDPVAMASILAAVAWYYRDKILDTLPDLDGDTLDEIAEWSKDQVGDFVDSQTPRAKAWGRKMADFGLGGGFGAIGMFTQAVVGQTPAEIIGVSPTGVFEDAAEVREEMLEVRNKAMVTSMIVVYGGLIRAKSTLRGIF